MININRSVIVKMIVLTLLLIGMGSCGSEAPNDPMKVPVNIVLPEINKPLPQSRKEEDLTIGQVIDEYRGIPV